MKRIKKVESRFTEVSPTEMYRNLETAEEAKNRRKRLSQLAIDNGFYSVEHFITHDEYRIDTKAVGFMKLLEAHLERMKTEGRTEQCLQAERNWWRSKVRKIKSCRLNVKSKT